MAAGATSPLSSNRLRALRTEHKLDLTALAAELGKSASTYSRYEQGTTAVPDPVKRALVARYGVTVEHLMGWDSPSEAAA